MFIRGKWTLWLQEILNSCSIYKNLVALCTKRVSNSVGFFSTCSEENSVSRTTARLILKDTAV